MQADGDQFYSDLIEGQMYCFHVSMTQNLEEYCFLVLRRCGKRMRRIGIAVLEAELPVSAVSDLLYMTMILE